MQNVTKTHNVGTAVLVRNSCPVKIKRVESRSRALVVTLEGKNNINLLSNLYLCSVHLDADKSRDPVKKQHHQSQRQSQLKSLLKRVNLQCKFDNIQIEEAPILVAGDFNMLRDNPLTKMLAASLRAAARLVEFRVNTLAQGSWWLFIHRVREALSDCPFPISGLGPRLDSAEQ